MELKQLKALQAIAETGSFNDAAEQLGLTQSALSHQIRNLEEELDETLLIRARPRAYPTPAGLAVISAAKKIMAELDQIRERFARAQKGPVTGTLRIAATNLAVVHILGDLCESFIGQYPGIDLIFRATETPEEAIRRVVAGAADIAFSPFPVDNDQLVRVMLGATEHAFIVSESHPLAEHVSLSINDVRPYPFVRFAPGSGTRGLTDSLFLPNGGYPPILTESNDAEFVKRVVAMGQGISLLPVFAVGRGPSDSRLRLVRFDSRRLMADFGIFHRRAVKMNSIELFKQMCLDLRGPTAPEITVERVGDRPFLAPRPA